MLTLTDLLSGAGAAPEGLRPPLSGAALPVPAVGFAATLESARTAAATAPGLPTPPISRALPGGTPGPEGFEDTGDAAVAAALPVPPGFGEHDQAPHVPAGGAASTISTEGTGQGRPGGNGLPLPGPYGGKFLPDLPPVQALAAPSSSIASVLAGRISPGPSPQSLAAAVRMSMAGVTAAPATSIAAAATGAGSSVSPPAVPDGALPNAQAVAAIPADPRSPIDGATAAASRTDALVGPPAMAAASAGKAGAADAGAPLQGHAADGAAGHPSRSAAAPSIAADGDAGTPSSGPAAIRGGGTERMSSAAERGPMSQAQFQNLVHAAAGAVDGDGGTARRDPGAADARLPGQQGAVAQELRSTSQDALQPVVGPAADQARTAARPDPAASGVLDRRLIAETAGQRRGGDPLVPGGEEPDRTPAAGTESAEQLSRPQTARPVVPVLAGRDLSALAERIEMMVHRRGGIASVNLSLSELGDVEISVRIESRQAHVQFVVQDAAARDALEAQLPRLRAMLGDGGLDLGDVGTSLRDRAQGDAQAGGGEGGRGDHAGSGDTGRSAVARAGVMGADDGAGPRGRGAGDHLLDAFA